MELQLGLALSSNPIKDLNLNKYVNDPKDENWTHSCYSGKNKAHKRSFDEAFEIVSPLAPTLPLLSWNDKPNNEDDDDGANRKSLEKSSYCTIHKSNGEGDEIMGWPPIPRCRRNLRLLHHHHHQQQQQQQQNQAGRAQNDRRDEMGCRGFNSMYVKVKMEGVAIGRKVDLSLHRSYQTLTSTLITMFAEYRGDVNGRRYTLTYQDRNGDWLLVGDIPWQFGLRHLKKTRERKHKNNIGGLRTMSSSDGSSGSSPKEDDPMQQTPATSISVGSSSSAPKDDDDDDDAVQQNPAKRTLNKNLIKLDRFTTKNRPNQYSIPVELEDGTPYMIFSILEEDQIYSVVHSNKNEGRKKGLYIPMFVPSAKQAILISIADECGLPVFSIDD